MYAKYLFILLAANLQITFADAQTSNQFEEELRLLEKQEDQAIERIESLSQQETNKSMVSDQVHVGDAAALRSNEGQKAAPSAQESIPLKKTRRIRSR